MYYLIDCEEDSSVLICDETQLIVDREPEVKEVVKFMWKGPGKSSTKEYSGLMVAKSENRQELIEKEKNYAKKMSFSPKEYGKGLRKHIPKLLTSGSEGDDDDETLKEKKKKIKSAKELKKMEEMKTAKYISKKLKFSAEPTRTSPRKKTILAPQPEELEPVKQAMRHMIPCKECAHKDKEIIQLKKQMKKLRKERDESLELTKWLSDAKDLANNLRRPTAATQRVLGPSTSVQATHSSDTAEPQLFEFSKSGHIPKFVEDMNISDEEPQRVDDEASNEPHDEPRVEPRDEPRDELLPGNEDHFRFTAKDPEVTKLVEGYSIYVNKTIKERIVSMSKTHAQLARNAMEAVFRPNILKLCSLQGKPNKVLQNQRSGLDANGLSAVLKFAKKLAEEKNLKIEEEGYVKKQLSTRLCELRKSL